MATFILKRKYFSMPRYTTRMFGNPLNKAKTRQWKLEQGLDKVLEGKGSEMATNAVKANGNFVLDAATKGYTGNRNITNSTQAMLLREQKGNNLANKSARGVKKVKGEVVRNLPNKKAPQVLSHVETRKAEIRSRLGDKSRSILTKNERMSGEPGKLNITQQPQKQPKKQQIPKNNPPATQTTPTPKPEVAKPSSPNVSTPVQQPSTPPAVPKQPEVIKSTPAPTSTPASPKPPTTPTPNPTPKPPTTPSTPTPPSTSNPTPKPPTTPKTPPTTTTTVAKDASKEGSKFLGKMGTKTKIGLGLAGLGLVGTGIYQARKKNRRHTKNT